MADNYPYLAALMPEGSMWRGLAHGKEKVVDMGDISVLSHRRSGLECYLHGVQKRMTYPYPANDQINVDRHDHIRVGDGKGNVLVTFAPA